MMPKFSIIIPAHNSAEFISRCLDSIANQHYTDYELIIVCDRCTDNTAEIARAYEADIVLEVDNGNDGLTRGDGLAAAQGEWVLFLDDDDWWMHEHVLDLIDGKLSEDIDVMLFGFIFKGRGYAPPYRTVNGSQVLWPAVWCKCYRREFIKDLQFNNIEVKGDEASDIDWTRRLMELNPRYSYLDMPLYYYNYMRRGSQTDTKVFGNKIGDGG